MFLIYFYIFEQSMEQRQCVCQDLPHDSIVISKYYLQFADNFLIDLLKEALRNIVTFGATLSELPISELQRQIYLIYENTILKQTEVQTAVEEQFKKAARFHKKHLESVYLQMEKDKQTLNDTRWEGNCWLESFYRYRETQDESNCKTYGVIAQMFWLIFQNLNSSLNEVVLLLDHLMKEAIIPTFSLDHLKSSIFSIILYELTFMKIGSLGPDMISILPTLSSKAKQKFVNISPVGIEKRILICGYDAESDLDSEDFTTMVQNMVIEKRMNIEKSKKELSAIVDQTLVEKVKKKQMEENQVINQPQSIFDRIGEIVGDNYLDEFQQEEITQELNLIDAIRTRKKQEDKLSQDKDYYMRMLGLARNDNLIGHMTSLSQQLKKEKEETQLKRDEETQLKREEVKDTSKKTKQIEFKKEKRQPVRSSEALERIFSNCRKQKEEAQRKLKQQKQKEKCSLAARQQMKMEAQHLQGRLIKKTGKIAEPKDLQDLKQRLYNFKQEDKRWEKNLKNIPAKFNLQKEETLKLTKNQLKKIKKIQKLGQFASKEDIKVISQGNVHKIQIRNTYVTTDIKPRNSHITNEMFQQLTLNKHEALVSFMDDESEDQDLDRLYSVPGKEKMPQNQRKESCQEEEPNKKKKNKKNKKKKNKKNDAQKQVEPQKTGKSDATPETYQSKKVEEKSEEQIYLTSFLQSWRIEEKDRYACNSSDSFLGKCKDKIEKWRKPINT